MDTNPGRCLHSLPLALCSDLFDHLPIWVFALDEKCGLQWSNRSVQGMLGYNPSEIKGIRGGLGTLLNPADRELLEKNLKDAFENQDRRFFSFRTTLYHKERFAIYVLLRSYFFLEGKDRGSRPLLFFYALDETEKVLLSRFTERDKRLITIGTMTAEITHEIKNAIIAIGGLAMLAKRRHPDIRELDIIQSEAYRLERLTRSINTFVRPQGDNAKQADVLSVLKKSLCLLSPEIKKKNVKIHLRLCPELKALKVNNDALMEVFVNLIRNAVEALRPGGRLEIHCFTKDGTLAIDFKNEMEIKQVEDPQNIFKPLDEGGRSIGLPISNKIIKNMGGRLSFRRLGNYAIFRIEFPFEKEGDLSHEKTNNRNETGRSSEFL